MNSDRTYRYLTTGIILTFLLMGLFTLSDYGMGWDEQVRWKSGDLKLEHYQSLFSADANNLDASMRGDRYPGLFDLPLAAFHAAFGGNRMLQGHIWSLLFGALGLIATAWMGTVVFGARVACIATLLLAVLPHFYGHAMMNPKDIPFMATYSLGLASILWVTKGLLDTGKSGWKSFALCGLAVGLAGSCRIPGIVLLVIAATTWITVLIWRIWRPETGTPTGREIILLLLKMLITPVCVFFVILLFFPRAQLQLLASLPSVTSSLHSSASEIPLLFMGKVMDAGDGPFFYAHYFFLISTPLWILGLLAAGVFFSLKESLAKDSSMQARVILQSVLLLMAVFPWVYVLVTRPALHNGIRHMLFGIPPLLVFAAYGTDRLLIFLHNQKNPLRLAGYGLMAALLLSQVFSLIRMHPYQYVSFNAMAGTRSTVPNRYEAEYWFTSTKHLLEELPAVAKADGLMPTENSPIRVRVSGPLDSARPFIPSGFILVDSFKEADYYVSNTTFRTDLLAEGKVVYQIERGGIPIGLIKKLSGDR